MSDEQNPTQKAKPAPGRELEELSVAPICPHCSRVLPGLTILSMELPTERGGMIWFLPSCPFIAQGRDEQGALVAVDGGPPCGKVITAQWSGQYTAKKIATPGAAGWMG